jgi:hypothetical protein
LLNAGIEAADTALLTVSRWQAVAKPVIPGKQGGGSSRSQGFRTAGIRR